MLMFMPWNGTGSARILRRSRHLFSSTINLKNCFRIESKTKELFLCYCKFALVDPSTFQGITLYDLI